MATNYQIGNRVKFNNVAYVALNANVNQQPDTSADWETVISRKLREIKQSVTYQTVNDWLQGNNTVKKIKTLNNTSPLWNELQFNEVKQNNGEAVGFQIFPTFRQGTKFFFSKIGLKTTQSETFKLYVYHTSQQTPLKDIDITTTSEVFQWVDIELDLSYFSDLYNVGGAFYILAYESELTGEFYKQRQTSAAPPVYYPYSLYSINKNFSWKFAYVSFNQTQLNGTDLPDVGNYYDRNSYESFAIFNFLTTEIVDYSEILTRQVEQWDNALNYALAIRFMKLIVNSKKINRETQDTQDTQDLIINVFGQVAGAAGGVNIKGLQSHYNEAIQQISIDFDGFDFLFQTQRTPRLIG